MGHGWGVLGVRGRLGRRPASTARALNSPWRPAKERAEREQSRERVEQKEVEVSHPLLVNELLGADHLPSELRWMIFKVKMKAVKNYYSKVPKAGSKLEDQKYVFEFDVAGEKQKLKYSYNWPYDFFSIVEMAKIDAEVNFVGESK